MTSILFDLCNTLMLLAWVFPTFCSKVELYTTLNYFSMDSFRGQFFLHLFLNCIWGSCRGRFFFFRRYYQSIPSCFARICSCRLASLPSIWFLGRHLDYSAQPKVSDFTLGNTSCSCLYFYVRSNWNYGIQYYLFY